MGVVIGCGLVVDGLVGGIGCVVYVVGNDVVWLVLLWIFVLWVVFVMMLMVFFVVL